MSISGRSTSGSRGLQSTGSGGAGNFRSPSRGYEGTGREDYYYCRDPIRYGDPSTITPTGRGGAGNFRAPTRGYEGTSREDYRNTRGRDFIPYGDPSTIISTGRGGRGNIRSPSRDAPRGDNGSVEGSLLPSELRGRGYDRELISAIDSANNTGLHSFGRSGAGNIFGARANSLSPARDYKGTGREDYRNARGRDPILYGDPSTIKSTGRGGIGNIRSPSWVGPPRSEVRGRDYDREHLSAIDSANTGMHSFGRSGAGNILGVHPNSTSHVRFREPAHATGRNHPHGEHKHRHDYESSGRGGAGNKPPMWAQGRAPWV